MAMDWLDGGGHTPVPDLFIERFMARADNPMYALVYIMACRFVSAGLPATVKETAERLNMTAEAVLEAWRYWEAEGLAKLRGAGEEAAAELLPIERGGGPLPIVKPAGRVRTEKPPMYPPEEIGRIRGADKDAEYLVRMAQGLLAKPLTYHEVNAVISLYDWLGLTVPVIESLLDYCVSNGKRNMRYIEKVGLDWADNGIETAEDAEAYIKLFNGDYRDIMRAFGHTRRDPAAAEQAYMKKWLKVYKMPIEVIKAAADKTVIQIGEPKFAYADAILTKWHEHEVRTPEEIQRLEEAFYDTAAADGQKTGARKAEPPAKRSRNKFMNHAPREWDYASLEKLEQMHIDQKLGDQ